MLQKAFYTGLLSLFLSKSVHAQNAQLEAKAAYLLAEESYGKGDMRSALDYVNDATGKLGASNAKISYLKVVILKEMSLKDTAYGRQLDKALLEFEKAPDIADFNEEKSLEIMKIKLERKRQVTLVTGLDQRIKDYQQKIGWPIGIRSDSLVVLRKDIFDTYFKKHPSNNGKLPNYYIWLFNDPAERDLREMLTIKNDSLKSYARYFYSYINTETANFDKSTAAQPAILQNFQNEFGYLPEPKMVSDEYGAPDTVQRTMWSYNWQTRDVIVWLVITHLRAKSGNSSTCVLSIAAK